MKILLTNLLLLCTQWSIANTCSPSVIHTSVSTYTVIAIRGTIKNTSNGKWLRPRSQFNTEDKLLFSSPNAKFLAVDHRGLSFMGLKSTTARGFHLRASNQSRGTRQGPYLSFSDLQKYFAIDTIHVFDEQLDISVNPGEFPMNEEQFFYLQYEWEGEVIPKKLPFEGNTFSINLEQICMIEGQAIEKFEAQHFKLFYYDAGQEIILPIGDFHLNFLDTDTIKSEVDILLEAVINVDTVTQKDAVENFIGNYYGVFDINNFEDWLAKHFDL